MFGLGVVVRGSFWLFRPGGGCLWLSATAEWFRTCDEVPQLRRGPATAEKFRYCGEDPALGVASATAERSRDCGVVPGQRDLLAGSIWGIRGETRRLLPGGETCLRALFWGIRGEAQNGCSTGADLAKVVGRSRAALTQLSRRPSEDLAQVLQPIEQLSATKIMRALDPRRQGEATFFPRLPPHNLIIS